MPSQSRILFARIHRRRGLSRDPKAHLFKTYSRASGQLTANPPAPDQRLCDDPEARAGRRHHDQDRQPHVSGERASPHGSLERAAQMANHASTRRSRLRPTPPSARREPSGDLAPQSTDPHSPCEAWTSLDRRRPGSSAHSGATGRQCRQARKDADGKPETSSAQSLRRRARDIGRDAHPDSAIATKIDERKRRGDFDLYVTPNVELPLIHGIVADSAVAAIAQHRLQEADLERFAEIDDAKSMGGDASAGIAEAAWRLAKPERVRVAIEDNSTKSCARVDRRQMQRGAIERRPRVGSFRHSGERLGDAFRRFDDVGRPALAKRVAARLAI